MIYGMLWFDNDPKTDLEQKVEGAAGYYRNKYRQEPNICYVNPKMLNGSNWRKVGEVKVLKSTTILPHHLWIGVRYGKSTSNRN